MTIRIKEEIAVTDRGNEVLIVIRPNQPDQVAFCIEKGTGVHSPGRLLHQSRSSGN